MPPDPEAENPQSIAPVIPAFPPVIPAQAGTQPNEKRPAQRVPHIFLCVDCEAETHSPDHHIPVGWSQSGPDIRCPDCTASLARRAVQ